MTRRILTQREQWPFRCAAPEDSPPAAPKPPALPSNNPVTNSLPGYKPPAPGPHGPTTQLDPGKAADPQAAGEATTPKLQAPFPRPQKPLRPGQTGKPTLPVDIPSVEAAGIEDVDYSHLPFGRPEVGNPTTQSGGGGSSNAPTGTGGYGATPSAGGPAPASGDEASWKARIQKDVMPQLQQRGITDPAAVQKAVDSIYQQGITESGWRDVPQAISDVNSAKGTPAQSYLQYVPSTFNRAMDLAGTPGANIHDPDAQIRGVIPLEESEGKFGPGGFSDSSGSGVGYGHGWG